MKKLKRTIDSNLKLYPERILQFGDGNFLRAFADWVIYKMNKEADFNSGIVVVSPRNNENIYKINEQDGLYTLLINGVEKGELKKDTMMVDSITRAFNTYRDYDEYLKTAENPDMRFIISNTTEAGIEYINNDKLDDRPQVSFPGKLTAWLYHRYKMFNGDMEKGMLILPCELIDKNGENLKSIVLKYAKDWGLEDGFVSWINEANIFYNTLVDRIVPGYPKENAEKIQKELGYEDEYLVEAEWFHLWVIEGPEEITKEFPADEIGLNVIFVDDLTAYRERKVRILNGAHTSMVPVAYLYGIDTVRESVENEVIGKYMNGVIFEEIIPTLDLPEEELKDFAESVLDRFRNPFIKHYLISISLNSMSKFETRVLPSLLEYHKRKEVLPERLVFSLASLIYFYKGDRNGEKIDLNDNENILKTYEKLWGKYDGSDERLKDIVKTVLALEDLWNINLNDIEGMTERVYYYLNRLINLGMKESIKEVI
ncbi:MAG TPA: tagaturonate reductase [Tissierellales bacterium]|nr:tagaturonate reductase [Tissierellales bacterium]